MATLTIGYTEFRDLLTPVLPLAGKDDMLPVLTGILIEAHGRDTVTALATDRFRAGLSRVVIPTATRPRKFSALLPAKQLAAVIKACKPARRKEVPTLTLVARPAPTAHNPEGQRVTITSDRPNAAGYEPAFTLTTIDGKFPGVLDIIAKAHDPNRTATTDMFGLNPAFLADFRHAVRDRHEGLSIRAGETHAKPVGIAAGDYFLGAIMPKSLIGEDVRETAAECRAGWSNVLGPVEPEAKAS